MTTEQPKQRPRESYSVALTRAGKSAGPTGQGVEPARSPVDVPREAKWRSTAGAGGLGIGTAHDQRGSPPSIAKPNELTAVIDGADRLAYSDLRDRKGWRLPLAESEALAEVRRHRSGDGTEPGVTARIVRTLETSVALQPAVTHGASTTQPTPYARGKDAAKAVTFGRERQQSLQREKAEPFATRSKTR